MIPDKELMEMTIEDGMEGVEVGVEMRRFCFFAIIFLTSDQEFLLGGPQLEVNAVDNFQWQFIVGCNIRQIVELWSWGTNV